MEHHHPLSPGGGTFALLDANVLLPPRLSDVLFDMCLTGLFYARWTDNIETEFLRCWSKVVAKRQQKHGGSKRTMAAQPGDAETVKALRRLSCFRGAVSAYEVLGYDAPAVLARVPAAVHPGDKHVAAAAIVMSQYVEEFGTGDRVYIVSNNLRHLAVRDMAQLGISVASPGHFIDSLTRADRTRVGLALDRTLCSLENPPYTRQLLLAALDLHGAQDTVRHFREAWNLASSPGNSSQE